MDFQRELTLLLRARCPFVCVVSNEEERILRDVAAVCERDQRYLYTWDHADYFVAHSGQAPAPPKAQDPLSALEAIDQMKGSMVFILHDFHQCWQRQPRVARKLRNLVHRLRLTRKSVICTMPRAEMPVELRHDTAIIEYPAPSARELTGILKELLKIPGVRVDLKQPEAEQLVQTALGLSSNQAQRVFAKAIVTDGVLDRRDIDLIAEEKKQLIRESGALEFFRTSETASDIGGLRALKHWLDLRLRAFSPEARKYGLPRPRGLALIGLPGTGKSLTAKMISSQWRLPLVRLDVGALFGGLVGQSEENTRKALHLAEAVAPCIMWIDEMEKALATGSGDSGTSRRVLGSILSWMQEKQKPVFVVATANDISTLPPELLRRGRFDEIFFLDLPNVEERREIFGVHICKRGRDPAAFDIARLAEVSEGFVGAEIEHAVIDAMFVAFSDTASPAREFTTQDIVDAVNRQVPLSRSQREAIESLRLWLREGRAVSASELATVDLSAYAVPMTPSAPPLEIPPE